MEHKKEVTVKHILTMDSFEANIVTVALTHMMEEQEDILRDIQKSPNDNAYGRFPYNEEVCKKIIEFCDLTIAYLNE
jgi:hypothetical protein